MPQPASSRAVAGQSLPRRISDIAPGPASSDPGSLISAGDTLYFVASDGPSGPELWKIEDPSEGAKLVKNINTAPFRGAYINQLTAAAGRVFFTAAAPVEGTETGLELWTSDGSEEGTRLIADLRPGPYGSNPSNLTATEDYLFFAADQAGNSNGRKQLWRYDLRNGGRPTLVSDVPLNVQSPIENASSASPFLTIGNTVYFTALTDEHGYELWKSDGTPRGTTRLTDINPGYASSHPSQATAFKGDVYFNANNITSGDSMHGHELWKYDIGEGTTSIVKDINPDVNAGGSNPNQLTVFGDSLYFVAKDASNGYQVWRTDGTSENTIALTRIGIGELGTLYPASPRDLTATKSHLFFKALSNGSPDSLKLWKIDSRGSSPQLVPTTEASQSLNLTRSGLTAAGDQVFFMADQQAGNVQLWTSDGRGIEAVTPTGNPLLDSRVKPVLHQDALYFAAGDSANGVELWTLPLSAAEAPAYSSRIGRSQIWESGGVSSRWESRITFTDPSASLREVYWATESLSTTTIDGNEVPAVNAADFIGAFGRPQSGFSSLTGSATVQSNGSASFDLKVAADRRTEGDEEFRIVFYKDARRTQEIHRTDVLTIKDSSRDSLTYQSTVNTSPPVDQNGTPILSRNSTMLESGTTPFSTPKVTINFRTNDKDLSSVYWTTQSTQKLAIGNNRFDAVNKYDFLAPDGRPLAGLLPLSGTATVRNGAASIALTAAADHVLEDDEKFRVVFYKDAELTRELHRTDLITIKDTSNLPLVSLEGPSDNRAREGNTYLLALSREGSTNNSLDVRLRSTGEALFPRDYRLLNKSLRFEEGESQINVRVQTLDDALEEGPPELLTLALAPSPDYEINPQKASSTLRLEDSTILRSDIPVVEEGETLQFRLTRSNPAQDYSDPLYVIAIVDGGSGKGAAGNGARAGADYRRDGAYLFMFPAGARETTVAVKTLEDRISESAYEDLNLHIMAPIDGLIAYTFTGIIVDDDRDPVTGGPTPRPNVVANQIASSPNYGSADRINPNLARQQLRAGLVNNPRFLPSLLRDVSSRGGLVGNDSASLVGNDSASLVGNDSASLVGNDSASLLPGATVIPLGSSLSNISANAFVNTVIPPLIANGGGNLVANGGGNLVANGGGN